jgi:hypothetical protein
MKINHIIDPNLFLRYKGKLFQLGFVFNHDSEWAPALSWNLNIQAKCPYCMSRHIDNDDLNQPHKPKVLNYPSQEEAGDILFAAIGFPSVHTVDPSDKKINKAHKKYEKYKKNAIGCLETLYDKSQNNEIYWDDESQLFHCSKKCLQENKDGKEDEIKAKIELNQTIKIFCEEALKEIEKASNIREEEFKSRYGSTHLLNYQHKDTQVTTVLNKDAELLDSDEEITLTTKDKLLGCIIPTIVILSIMWKILS